ncbi:serine/threonine protein kinase [Cystobacter fuscus]|uniref:non-specific serine/threonine protein kinase n=1 Tax=Cystobacter fuscus TaxID=43 RepID=A0A250JHY5_9BACT|nr:serine/threonine-protein kinase [Cystobacter fuscus]ATB43243.1 serine/threonine protein kinase [Cystobacter fuscus]
MPSTDKPVVKHRKIGAYRVLGELGRGGMAQVYRGLHEMLQREVAIKEMLADPLRDKESVSRFRREALALAAFRHQNIVTLYDLVEKNDVLFMVMEYVDGPTLHELIKEGALPPEVGAAVAARIADALEHAHFRRIIHRDLKPANVMLTKAGDVKLMDFGVAKDVGLEALTAQGMAVGTPSYMSPEQVTGAPIDGRTDLFSLGVLMYESLAGQRPFLGRNAGEVFARIREGAFKPLHKAAPQVPKALADIVHRALRVKPEERYPNAAAMRRDLEAFLSPRLGMSCEAFLVGFLRHREKLTESEALAHLTQEELGVAGNLARELAPVRPWKRWLAAFAIAAGGVGAGLLSTQSYWMELVQRLSVR